MAKPKKITTPTPQRARSVFDNIVERLQAASRGLGVTASTLTAKEANAYVEAVLDALMEQLAHYDVSIVGVVASSPMTEARQAALMTDPKADVARAVFNQTFGPSWRAGVAAAIRHILANR